MLNDDRHCSFTALHLFIFFLLESLKQNKNNKIVEWLTELLFKKKVGYNRKILSRLIKNFHNQFFALSLANFILFFFLSVIKTTIISVVCVIETSLWPFFSTISWYWYHSILYSLFLYVYMWLDKMSFVISIVTFHHHHHSVNENSFIQNHFIPVIIIIINADMANTSNRCDRDG